MAITKPLEYDKTGTELLYRIGQRAAEEELKRQQLEANNQAKQYAVLSQIDPEILYSKYDKQIVDKYIGQMQQGAADFLKANPNANYITLQSEINKGLAKISGWSSKVKSIRDRIERDVRSADRIYDKGRLLALSLDEALYKTDANGNKVLKDEQELTPDIPWVSDVAKKKKSLVIDPYTGEEAAFKSIRNPNLFSSTETTVSPDGRKSFTVRRRLPFYLDESGDIKRMPGSNYVDENVFQQFYRNPEMSVWIDAMGEDLMNNTPLEKRTGDPELYKRAFLTNWLDLNKGGVLDLIDKSLITRQKTKSSNPTTQYLNATVAAFDSNDPLKVEDYLYRMSSGNGKWKLTNDGIEVSADGKVATIKYDTGKRDKINRPEIKTRVINRDSPTFLSDLVNTFQMLTGSSVKAEEFGLTGVAPSTKTTTKQTAKPAAKKTGAGGL